ncbi:Holliday junction branch migration protein RuvA [Candidatus Aerophobetes bacterium]|uniref:Holliday junction branch migration complex subunit RuvA n=1 Tax=Aerophobetes bacterium TaxID=2030807 RepID=A0A2A4X4D8_UNCAE|nr:MAG: Holliday junction branch migration protein RuvA [Candidatus Aerophobetes bacterium]
MYDFIQGTLKACHPNHVTLENGGIGYLILTPISLFQSMPKIETKLLLYTHLVVREDSMRLFGFETPAEKQLFISLSDVSGIGPKTALSIIGHKTPSELGAAIATSDIASLSSIPGIGKKTAERLFLEMKDKLPKMLLNEDLSSCVREISTLEQDAQHALMGLGYKKGAAEKAIAKILSGKKDENLSLSDVLKLALQTN